MPVEPLLLPQVPPLLQTGLCILRLSSALYGLDSVPGFQGIHLTSPLSELSSSTITSPEEPLAVRLSTTLSFLKFQDI